MIVDEAHRGLGGAGVAFDRISTVAADGTVLLVTATPFQLSASGFAQMLETATRKSERSQAERIDRGAIEEYTDALVAILRASHHASGDQDNPPTASAIKAAQDREEKLRRE